MIGKEEWAAGRSCRQPDLIGPKFMDTAMGWPYSIKEFTQHIRLPCSTTSALTS